jgi:glycosyltransferase involved in cell wall biosynthesis
MKSKKIAPSSFFVAHLTTVHPRWDTRILKMCTSLVKSRFVVYLIVADGKGDEIQNGFNIVDIGNFIGRLRRIFNGTRGMLKKALDLNADLYHIHDPELLPVAIMLIMKGKKVIFDSHENIPKQILSKPYLNKPLLYLISKIYSIFEILVCKRLSGIVAATPNIRDKFSKFHNNVIDINNYPVLSEFEGLANKKPRKNMVCYVGGISLARGINEIVDSLTLTKSNVTLNLVGEFSEQQVKRVISFKKGWQLVNDFGFLDRAGIKGVFSNSLAGLVTFHALPNHIDAKPNKMFEYMSAGLPIIVSDFPLWRDIVEKNQCGLCIDPLVPKEIAQAIDYMVTYKKEAKLMGKNGRNAVLKKYNWAIEERKLINFYYKLLE